MTKMGTKKQQQKNMQDKIYKKKLKSCFLSKNAPSLLFFNEHTFIEKCTIFTSDIS